MNIDLLTKLVRLANNNPNENEANLAARKVCRIIQEGNFDFGHIERVVDRPYQGGTYNDIKRSTEPAWSSKPQEPNYRYQEDWFKRFYQEYKEKYRYTTWEYDPPNKDYKQDPLTGKYKQKQKEKRPLNCTKCGKMYMTAYMGNLFVCNVCHWSDYNANKQSDTD